MAEQGLSASPALGGADIEIAGNRIREETGLALVSVAVPQGGEEALAAALKSGLGLDMPQAEATTRAGAYRAIRIAPDQLMIAFDHPTPDAEPHVRAALDGSGYTTDQTDAWVKISVSGTDTLAALERLCPLDLHDASFPVGKAARTVMEHMGAMILRTGDDSFLLLSASSSGHSFLHAVETSFHYVT